MSSTNSEFDARLIGYLVGIQNKSSSNLSTRIKLNISREELDWIVCMLKYGKFVDDHKKEETDNGNDVGFARNN